MMSPACPPAATDAPAQGRATITFARDLVTRVISMEMLQRPEDLGIHAYRAAVRAALAGDRDRRQSLLDEASRQAFRDLGHETAVTRCLGRRCLAREDLHVAIELPPEGAAEGLATLDLGWPPGRVTLRVAAERFLSDSLRDLLLPELEVVEEMLDPAFGYAGALPPAPAAVLALWRAHATFMLEEHGLLDAPRPSLSATLSALDPGPPDVGAALARLARPDLTYAEMLAMASAGTELACGALARSCP
jgi:hypothetical protein